MPYDLKKLSFSERLKLSGEIRHFLIDAVSKTGGHLASNLGVVEITIALHKVFNFPDDKIVFDVGHQCYTHKILTGRKDKFSTLRQEGGLSGFPKCEESEFDFFNTGHSSTSISAALGLARARDLENKAHKVIAFTGDGAMTGGLSYEALCDAGNSDSDLLVILNDNTMSITKNVGGLSEHLSRLRTQPSYVMAKSALEHFILKLYKGKAILSIMRKAKNALKRALMHKNIFEELGFTYLGAIDGNNLKKCEQMLTRAKNIKGPVLLHILTVKGKGYSPAEEKPSNFHGISKFNIETGDVIRDKVHADYSAIFGRHMVYLAKHNEKLVSVSPAMILGSGLKNFFKLYPERSFDVGIAEEHAVTFAAGLARGGFIPVVSVYSSFLQRAYDQIIHDVSMQNLHVIFAIDRAGAVGADGKTHQGVFDMAFLNHIPNMTILVPSNFEELCSMLDFSVNEIKGPVAIRYPRGRMQSPAEKEPFSLSKAEVIHEGADISIIAIGPILKNALLARDLLLKDGYTAEVISVKTLKPIDEETIASSALKTKNVITIEDGELFGGLSSSVNEILLKRGISPKVLNLGYTDYLEQATCEAIYEKNSMSPDGICKACIKLLRGE